MKFLSYCMNSKKSVVAVALLWTAIAVLVIPLSLSAGTWRHFIQSVALASILFLFFAVVISYALKYEITPPVTDSSGSRWLVVGGVLLCAAVWLAYGIVFYPGLVSWDIYVQWHEMSGTLPRSDWHPFFHTSLIWLLTRIWHSPAMIMTAQILSMLAAVGLALLVLQKIEIPQAVIAGVILFYAFFPLNGFYAVSLWKDINYSAAFLWLTLLFITIASSKGKELAKQGMLIQLFFALCCIAMMRHNGIVPAFGSLLVLFALYCRSQFKRVLLLSVAVVAAVALFRGPALDNLGVEVKSRKAAKAQVLVQHIGAILNDGGKLSAEEEQFLTNILPITHWKGGYQARSCMPLICGKDQQGQPFFHGIFLQDDANYKHFLKIWANLALRHPVSILKYYANATELIWRIHAPYGIFVIPDEGLNANDLYSGYKPSPPLKEQVGDFGKLLLNLLLGHPAAGWLLYRGALYFWLSIFFLSLAFIRSRKATVPVAAAPMLLQVATVAAFPLAQDTRYMYPVILTVPLFIALYFSPKFSNSSMQRDAQSAQLMDID